jgi:hypothetical protein
MGLSISVMAWSQVASAVITVQKVLDKIEAAHHVHFVYNATTVDTRARMPMISLTGTVDEVLSRFTAATGINARRTGQYVVLKMPAHAPARVMKQEVIVYPEDSVVVVANESVRPSALLSGSDVVLNGTRDLTRYEQLTYSPLRMSTYIEKRTQSKSYFAVAAYGNERGNAGVESGIGRKGLFALLSADQQLDGSWRMSYGLGSLLPINRHISLYPSWRVGFGQNVQDIVLTNGSISIYVQDGLVSKTTTHQFKLLGRFRISSRLDVQVGPTASLSKVNHHFNMPDVIYVPVSTYSGGRASRSMIAARTPEDYSESKQLIGLELGINYRLSPWKWSRPRR